MSSRGNSLFLYIFLFGSIACGSRESTSVRRMACELLSAPDIAAVQGEAVIRTQGSEHPNPPFTTSQCFYQLPTFNKSISLEVTRPAGPNGTSRIIEEFWNHRFGDVVENPDAEEEMSEGLKIDGRAREGRDEERQKARPKQIPGLGDEAYWSGTQINGSLYVRKGDAVVRLGLGGPEDETTKIRKASELARRVLEGL